MSDVRGYAVCVLTAVLIIALAVPTAAASPTTPDIERVKTQAVSARRQLGEIQADLEERVEEYDALSEQLDATRREIAKTERDLATAVAARNAAHTKLSGRATEIYKGERVDVVSMLLGTTSFTDLVARLDLLARITSSDARLVSEVADAVERVQAAERTLETRESEQASLRALALAKRRTIEAEVNRQREFLRNLDDQVKRLIAAEEARQRELAEERARQAAEAARARAEAGGSGLAGATDGPGAGHPEVVDVALRYLGVRYVWGGSTPAGFDCSGLAQYCYAQIGITIPRTSRVQFRAGTHIARDRLDLLVPGDLVFFGRGGSASRVHHVGIYSGDGNFIHAPATGDVVKVSSLTERIAERGDYVGASRF